MIKGLVYIAGKITGEDPVKCAEKFNRAEERISARGYHVVNPMKLVEPGTPWHAAMRVCFRELTKAQFIYLLPDWRQSYGAKLEIKMAIDLSIATMKDDMLELRANEKLALFCSYYERFIGQKYKVSAADSG